MRSSSQIQFPEAKRESGMGRHVMKRNVPSEVLSPRWVYRRNKTLTDNPVFLPFSFPVNYSTVHIGSFEQVSLRICKVQTRSELVCAGKHADIWQMSEQSQRLQAASFVRKAQVTSRQSESTHRAVQKIYLERNEGTDKWQ
jgi:hypothetical protein